MPLSEHEQRLLDQMEQALYDDDPKFVSRLAEDPQRAHTRKRVIIGSAVVLLGLGVVVLGVVSQQVWLGGLGFAVMVAGGAYALTPGERRADLGTVADDGSITRRERSSSSGMAARLRPSGGQRSSSAGTFMQRMEERWERRRRDGW